jgi:DNA-binding PadR family transcriptional regulator
MVNGMDKASTLDCVLLGLIEQAPRSGYDLRKAFALTPLRHFSDSPGAIYPALRRLERRGWIAADGDAAASRRGRRAFRLTPRGRGALVAWLRKPPTRADLVWGLDDLMPRFAFMSQCLSRAEIGRYLRSLEAEVGAYVRELERFPEVAGPMSFTGRLAFEEGVETYRTLGRWARRALAELGREGRKS